MTSKKTQADECQGHGQERHALSGSILPTPNRHLSWLSGSCCVLRAVAVTYPPGAPSGGALDRRSPRLLVSMQIIGVTFDVPRIDRGIEAFEYKQRWKHGKLFDSINNY